MPAILLGSISTLADTSELQRESFNAAFAEHDLDWIWSHDDYVEMLQSNGGADRVSAYAADRGEQVDADAVHATKSRIFQDRLRGGSVELRPGVADLIAGAKAEGLKIGLVTTTSRDNIEALAAGIRELSLDDFDVVVDRSDVHAPKPDPEAYTVALDRLGELPGDAVAVEDNVGGVAAAKAAGVAVAAFPNANTAGHSFDEATDRIDHLDLAAVRGLAA